MSKQLFIALFIVLMPCAALAQGGDARSYYDRGNAYYDRGDHDRAIAEYTKAIGLDPKHVIAYHNRGNSYRAKRDLDRAIADFTKSIDSIRNTPSPTATAPSPTAPRATTTVRLPTTPRPSNSI